MQTLRLNLLHRGAEGEPLPTVYSGLGRLGAHIRRGQVTMIAGPSGVGKTTVISHLVRNVEDEYGKLPGVYFSADCDKMTFGKAALAGTLNVHQNEAEKKLMEGDKEAYRLLGEATDHMWISFQSAPTPRDIREEVDAFIYTYGEYPSWIVIDNLMDVTSAQGDSQWIAHDQIVDFLKQLGRETASAIIINLHTVGGIPDDQPIPLDALMNNVHRRARLVITVHRADQNVLGLSIVKNSGGAAKSDGSLFVPVPWVPETNWIGS